jgi:hypothetical protein
MRAIGWRLRLVANYVFLDAPMEIIQPWLYIECRPGLDIDGSFSGHRHIGCLEKPIKISKMKLTGFLCLAIASTAWAQAPKFLPITPAKGTLLDSPPRLGLGTWYMRGNTSEAIAAAIELGCRHIDCAKIYGNQRAVGIGIANGIKRAGIARKDIWVTSKLWNSE